ncbi:MAG: YciI family protein [Myxococcaceae bacterium]
MQKDMQKWTAWIKELGDRGHLKNPGQPLEATGKVVRGKSETVTDGPYVEAKDVVGGYSVIEAKDLAHAAKLSSGCPIFAAGGLVEIRPIMKFDM